MLLFSLKESRQVNPLQVPQRGPHGEKYSLTGHFYLSIYLFLPFPQIPGKGAPSMFPNRVPIGNDTPSLEPLVYFSFIHSCMSAGVPRKEPPTYIWEKHKVTVHGDPRRRKAYVQWGAVWFPKGIVTALLSLPQCHAAFGTILSTLAWVDQSPVNQRVSRQPPSGYTLHNCYCLPHDPG